MADDFDTKANAAIKAEVRMISGCHDAQTSADVSNVGSFQLPDPAGRAGGACTSSLLNVLYADHQAPAENLSWVDTLRQMRTILKGKGFEQVPQLTSSRMIDVNETMEIVKGDGAKRALLIGINYVGQNGELSGCHNDVLNIKEYLMDVQGFEEENITVLMDDGVHHEPTRDNIIAGYRRLVAESVDGDTVFCHYSGHGGRLADDDGDEDDGYDETLIPVDFQSAGQIRDDVLFSEFVHPMAEGVTVTCLMDCCHSGTVLDLPYRFVADGESDVMVPDESVDFTGFLGDAFWLVASAAGSGGGGGLCDCIMAILGAILGGGGDDDDGDSD
eukprot:CAMPEP_0185735454 /NCGR_PEP_ID=MMETSP1171-20130828/25339_1 /TAXON_ID=374046 /ORGANISM="Helicotheca tamensis, Strain CCMP826" /LENGTH=329 /DNA_ID=CAMNT_0028405775 /DNA_START=34 /DNA_END=1023 /DNA_ORIENTATION=+